MSSIQSEGTEVTPKLQFPSLHGLLKLAIPISLGMASLSVLSLVETMILGHYSQVALAASASANYIFFVFLSAFAGFAIAIQSKVARHFDHQPEIAKSFTFVGLTQLTLLALTFIALVAIFHREIIAAQIDDPELVKQGSEYLWMKSWSLLPIAILMALRGFWHGINQPKVFLLCLISSHFITGVGCYALVNGKLGLPEMGLQGAAVSTVFSMAFGTAILWLMSRTAIKQTSTDSSNPSSTSLTSPYSKTQFKTGWHLAWPTSLQQVIFAIGTAVFMAIIAKSGVTILAAAHLIITLSLVLILPVIGIGMAATTFISNSYGYFQKGETAHTDCQHWYKLSLTSSILFVVLFGILLITQPEAVLGMMTDDQEVIDAAYWALIILAPSLFFEAITITTKQSLYAIHRNREVLKVLSVTQWFILLPVMLTIHILGVGSLEIYTLLHAGQRAINSVWLYKIWRTEHKKPVFNQSDIEVMV